MYRVITIGDKEVPMMAVASAREYYIGTFKEDPFDVLGKLDDQGAQVSFGYKIGFIMAKQAELMNRAEMRKLNYDAYLDWLDQFGSGDFLAACGSIVELFVAQLSTTAKEKNAERL